MHIFVSTLERAKGFIQVQDVKVTFLVVCHSP